MPIRKMLSRWNAVLGVVFVALLLACSQSGKSQSPDERVILSTNQEILARFKDPDSRAVVANFWATWCGPCRAEMPDLIRFYKTYTPKGVRFVSVSLDDPEAPGDDLIPYMDELKIPFPVLVPEMGQSTDELVGALDPNWGAGLPATFVFDPSGKVVGEWLGAVNMEELEATVNPMLGW